MLKLRKNLKFILLFSIGLFLIENSILAKVERTNKNNLVLDLSFNEVKIGSHIAKDYSLFSNDGFLRNTQVIEGKLKKGLDLNWESWIKIEDSPSLDITNEITLMGWFYPRAFTREWNRMIVKTQANDIDPWMMYGLHQIAGTNGEIAFSLSINNKAIWMRSEVLQKSHRWTHIACTYNGKYMKIFFDGEQVNRKAQTGKIDTNDVAVAIGRNNIGNREQFIGKIDEIAIWNIALTDIEIKKEMNNVFLDVESKSKLPLTWAKIKTK